MKKRIISILLASAMTLSLAACSGGGGSAGTPAPTSGGGAATPAPVSADAVHLSLGHTNNLDHHYQTLSEDFKEKVEAATNGAVVIDIYPAEQLGSGLEQLESVKSGTQDMVLDPDAYLANYDPIFNAIGLPYMFDSWDQIKAFPDSEAAKTLEAAAEAQGMVILGWAANGFRVTTSKTEINTPEDLHGLKIRVGSDKLKNDMITALGASPTSLSMSDTYNGIQTGIVDGQENPTSNIIGSKFYEVQPYLAVTHHQYVSEPLVMNKAKFDSLPAEVQEALLAVGKEVCAADVEYCAGSEESDLEFIASNDVTVTYPDLEAFKAILSPLVDTYCQENGEEFTKLVEQLKNM